MRPHHILLVDDNPDHALLARDALETIHGEEVEVEVARDGRAALDYLFRAVGNEEARTPNLILLDIKMPEVDGFEVLRRIKADDRLRVIPVVMLTSSDAEEDVARSYGLGSNSFVTKPVDGNALLERVASIPAYWFQVNTPPPDGDAEAA